MSLNPLGQKSWSLHVSYMRLKRNYEESHEFFFRPLGVVIKFLQIFRGLSKCLGFDEGLRNLLQKFEISSGPSLEIPYDLSLNTNGLVI